MTLNPFRLIAAGVIAVTEIAVILISATGIPCENAIIALDNLGTKVIKKKLN